MRHSFRHKKKNISNSLSYSKIYVYGMLIIYSLFTARCCRSFPKLIIRSTFSKLTSVATDISFMETKGFFLMKFQTCSLSLRHVWHNIKGLLSIDSWHNRQFRTISLIIFHPLFSFSSSSYPIILNNTSIILEFCKK